jgi:hypothetical protein
MNSRERVKAVFEGGEPKAPEPALFEAADAVIAAFRGERFIAGFNGGEIGFDMSLAGKLLALRKRSYATALPISSSLHFRKIIF